METQLSDVLFKEINLNKTRDDCSFPIKAIGKIGEKSKCKGTKIKMETLLYNLNKVINKSDIARVDYTKGGYKPNLGNGLEPLNDLFSDNILVYCPIPDNLVDKFTDTLKEEDDEEDKGLTKITNRSLIKIAQQLLASITANIKGIFNLCGIPINKPDIKPIAVVACKDSFIHKPSKYVQVLKVNMSCASLTDVFNLFTEHSKTLEDNNIFIHDIDFTRDYKGLFNKTELVDHLINNCGFRKENTYNDSDTTIIANSNTVSKNCLTFIKTVEGNGTIRYKFYNKFVQSMESPSVRNRVGSHINDWCNNPELELNRAINNSLETGILRLEITFYRYDTDKPLTKEFVTEQMDYLENLVSGERNPEVIYYNSIENQFNNLCDNILYNICLLDIDSKMAFVSLYHNSLTGKTNGFYIKDATSTKLSNALRYYTSKKPIIVVLIQQDKNNGIVSIQQDTYIKINTSGEDITTYLTTGSEFLHGIGIKDNITAKQPKEVGLIPNSTFNFAIPDKVASLIRSPNKNTCPYMFKSIPFTLLDYPNETLTIRSINKIIKEESNAEQFAENNKDKLEEIKAKNKEIAEELAKQQEEIAEEIALQKYIESNKNKLYTILKSIRCNTKKMLDLENNSILYIYGFKETNTKYGKTYLLAASTEGTLGDNTELDLYWSTTNINKYIEKVTTCYKKLDIHGIVAYGSLTGKPILVAKKVGEYISQTKNKCAAMEIVQRRNNTKEDTSILDKNLKLDTELEEIPDYIGVKGKPKLDSVVKEGDTITILGYRQTKASMLIKASIGDNTPEYYVATYWLCNIINSHVLENKNKFTVLAGPDKTAPNKHKFKTYVYK